MWCGFEPHIATTLQQVTPHTGSFAAFLIQQLVPNQSVDCLMFKRLPIPPRINALSAPRVTPTVGFEPTSTFAQLVFKTSTFTTRSRWHNADSRNRTCTTILLDSLASYWNTFIPYRQAPWQH